jgi:hypothetical protein
VQWPAVLRAGCTQSDHETNPFTSVSQRQKKLKLIQRAEKRCGFGSFIREDAIQETFVPLLGAAIR